MHRPKTLSSTGPDIHLCQFHPLGLIPKLVTYKQDYKYRQKDVTYHKACYTEWIQERCVSLEEYQEDIGSQGGVGAVWIPQCFERQVVD